MENKKQKLTSLSAPVPAAAAVVQRNPDKWRSDGKKLINGVLQNGGRCTAATQDFEKYTFVKNTFKKYTAKEKN